MGELISLLMKSRLASHDFWFYLLGLLLSLCLIAVAVSQLMPAGRWGWGTRLHASYTKLIHGLFLWLSVFFQRSEPASETLSVGEDGRWEGNPGRCASIQPRVDN